MHQPNRLKQALAERSRPLPGFWLTLASPSVTEVAAHAGFDWLLIDMEHSPNDVSDVITGLRAAFGGTAEAIVRVPWNDSVIVKRVMDCGARSLLFPYVESPEEAAAAVRATRYPPRGVRGHSATTRATNYGRDSDYNRNYEADICVIVQVETPASIGLAHDIAMVEGVDGVFIGPGDLSANMGLIGQAWSAVPVREASLHALAEIKRAGKAAGTLTFNEVQAKELFAAGFAFIAVGGDAALLAGGTDRLAAAFRTG